MTVDHAAILKALRDGESQNAVARRMKCSPSTVNSVAKANGLEYSSPKKAVQARKDYAAAERLDLLNQAFAKAEEMLPTLTTAGWLQSWTIAIGILIDKRRLEDGEATQRMEVHGDGARARIARRLDELAARRAAKGVA